MTSEGSVLIISSLADTATDEVVGRLSARGIAHYRLNTEDYPFFRALAFHAGKKGEEPWITSNGEALPPPTAVWYRRFRSPCRPEEMDPDVYGFCIQESRAALLGSVVGLSARWMSHPTAIWQAEFKPFQLSRAREIGLTIPRTVITNAPGTIRKAFAEFANMIVKPVRTGHIVSQGQEFAVFTSRVLEHHLENLESARWSPAIYQEFVPKMLDVRITVVGQRLFVAGIESQTDPEAVVDWRCTTNPRLPHHRITLPRNLEAMILDLMASLKLEFACIDMVQTHGGDYVFLEVNPNGQWLWLDDVLKLGISDAVADWLGGVIYAATK